MQSLREPITSSRPKSIDGLCCTGCVNSVIVALPTRDRVRSHAFYVALGFEAPGQAADDGVPEPLVVHLSHGAHLMLIPTGGFAASVAGRAIAEPGTVECLISLDLPTPEAVDALAACVVSVGGDVLEAPERQPWGYCTTFADPDGHLVQALVPD